MRDIVLERSIIALNQLADLMGYEKPERVSDKYYVAASKHSNNTQVEKIAFVKIDRDKSQNSRLNIVTKINYDRHKKNAIAISCQTTLYVAYGEGNGFHLILPQSFADQYFMRNPDPNSHYTIGTTETALNALVEAGAVCRNILDIFEQKITDDQVESILKFLPFEKVLMKALNNRDDRVIISESQRYSRNDAVSLITKFISNGICQLCEQLAPFCDLFGNPFLESHHIDWRSKNGPDTLENTVALCPNCHRKMHVVALKKDVEKLKSKAIKNYKDLIKNYPSLSHSIQSPIR